MPIPEKLADLLETLAMLDRQDRIQALISIAERFEPVPETVAAKPYPEECRVPGCESEAFVWSFPRGDGTLDFQFAVENPQGVSAKAFSQILKESLSGEPLDNVTAVPDDVVYRIFGTELSMGKSMGLMGILQSVKRLAANAKTR